MNHIKVIIKDLQEKQAIDITDNYQYKMSKLMIKENHRLSECKPRDASVWSKTLEEKALLKRCKKRHKLEYGN